MDVIWSVLSGLHFEPTTFFCQIALFMVMHWVLDALIYQPIVEMRQLRDKRLSSGLEAAEAAASGAAALKAQYDAQVKQAHSAGRLELAQAVALAEAKGKERVEKAQAEAEKILSKARAEADAARKKAEETVDAQSELVAQALARQLVSSCLDGDGAAPVLAKIGGGR